MDWIGYEVDSIPLARLHDSQISIYCSSLYDHLLSKQKPIRRLRLNGQGHRPHKNAISLSKFPCSLWISLSIRTKETRTMSVRGALHTCTKTVEIKYQGVGTLIKDSQSTSYPHANPSFIVSLSRHVNSSTSYPHAYPSFISLFCPSK